MNVDRHCIEFLRGLSDSISNGRHIITTMARLETLAGGWVLALRTLDALKACGAIEIPTQTIPGQVVLEVNCLFGEPEDLGDTAAWRLTHDLTGTSDGDREAGS